MFFFARLLKEVGNELEEEFVVGFREKKMKLEEKGEKRRKQQTNKRGRDCFQHLRKR